MYITNFTDGQDFTKSRYHYDLHYMDNDCGNIINLLKSEHAVNNYTQLLSTHNETIKYYKKILLECKNKISSTGLVSTSSSNCYNTMLYLTHILEQYASLIYKFIIDLETTNNDIVLLYWLRYINYLEALEMLSEYKEKIIEHNANAMEVYTIEDNISTLNYKTNLSAIQFVYSKINNNQNKDIHDLEIIKNIISEYEATHDDNILNKIKYIENKYKIVEGFSNTDNIDILIIFILLLVCFINHAK
jgi:hypothetical protein